MQEVRLLLVGRGRVGKTSLLKALRGTDPDKDEPETLGISVSTLELDGPQGKGTCHVWDFGGQEFLHGTHQIFLAERCIYLLVLAGRESNWETETDYWLRFIESFGGDSPVVVVMNKYDEHSFSVDRYRLQERCPQIVGFVETDAFSGRGISELKKVLEQTLVNRPDVWLSLPKGDDRVKQTLLGMPESYLEYLKYQTLCEEIGVDDTDKLAQSLHELGVALNFRDHHRLRLMSVLKPKWVTEAIYGLIRYVKEKHSNGVMPLSWIANALDPTEYPEDKHGFVLELMEKFEVAFALEGTQNWLIPELLTENQPEEFRQFRGSGVRRLRFSYQDALPPGLIPRLIVRTHEMSSAHPEWRWHSGVVLEWLGAQALVRLSRVERRTEVAVIKCPDDDRQTLLDLIRAHLTVLHGNVRVVEEVELAGHPGSWVRMKKLRLLEQQGEREIAEYVEEDELATVNVTDTLNDVESREARAAERDPAPARMRLFVSYAHEDERDIQPLSTHLTILGRRGYIQTWQDTQLIAGEEWQDRIREELGRADMVLMLYSRHSRASQFIQTVEGPEAVARAKGDKQRCNLIVVPLDKSEWDSNVELERELSTLQTATWNAAPLLDFKPRRNGWIEVENAIRMAVERRRKENDKTQNTT